MNPLLHTDALAVGHGRRVLLEGIGLRLAAGELVALVGVNGIGKSTLLRTLAGLRPPLAGSVSIAGRALHSMGSAERARLVSVVLTGRPAMGLIDTRTLVSLGRQPWTGRMGRLSGADHRAVEEAMERMGITAFAERGVHTLSDGESQKALIARALAQDTPVMLLDEPTAFLDLVNRVLVLRLLRGIAHSTGKAVLLTTHDLATALDLCDRILVLHAGAIRPGTPQETIASGVLTEAFGEAWTRPETSPPAPERSGAKG